MKTTTIAQTPLTLRLTEVRSSLKSLIRAIERWAVIYQRRKQVLSMMDMDTRMLRDIGLSHGDVAYAANCRSEDPTQVLDRIATQARVQSTQ